MMWMVLNPPEHNSLRTVPPDAEQPKELANALEGAELYGALGLEESAVRQIPDSLLGQGSG